MRRLIDADKLFDAMEETEWYNNADRDEIAERLIMTHQPSKSSVAESASGSTAERTISKYGVCVQDISASTLMLIPMTSAHTEAVRKNRTTQRKGADND